MYSLIVRDKLLSTLPGGNVTYNATEHSAFYVTSTRISFSNIADTVLCFTMRDQQGLQEAQNGLSPSLRVDWVILSDFLRRLHD